MTALGLPYGAWLGLCLTGLAVRMVYEALKQRGTINPHNKWVFLAAVLGMSLFLPSWYFFCPLDPWRVDLPAGISTLGLIMSLAGAGLALAALAALRGVENIDHLVTGGMFKYLRHPMYTGFILWIAGWILRSGAGLSLIVGVVSIGCVLWWARLEDEKLIEVYGEEYREYRKRKII